MGIINRKTLLKNEKSTISSCQPIALHGRADIVPASLTSALRHHVRKEKNAYIVVFGKELLYAPDAMRKTTTRFACSCVFSLLLCFCERAAATALSVGNGRASQRTGTRLVDVYYDVSGGVPPYTVTLQGSSDGGTTWTLPVTTVSGNVGVGVPAGTNLQVT